MARVAREKSESGVYHVMLRGINKQIIFQDDEDKTRFLIALSSFKDSSNYELYAYCLMDNHIHILMKEIDDSISTAIKRISSSYVYWYNKKYDRCGHLFQERFKSEAVEGEGYLLTVLRYIHQNPVKAGIVDDISEYKWTSYNEYINKAVIVNVDYILGLFSPIYNKARDLFVDFNYEENEEKCMDYEDFIKLTDDQVLKYISQLGVKNVGEFENMGINKRNNLLRELKSIDGISLRQLSRITGFSKSLIGKL